jgi:hypothetical protein
MKRLILALAIGLTTLGLAGVASAHPPVYGPVRVYYPPIITAPVITAPVIVQPAPIVVPPVEIVRPVYHGYFWGHHWR